MDEKAIVDELVQQSILQWDALAMMSDESYKKGGRGAIGVDVSGGAASQTDSPGGFGYITEKTLLGNAYSLGTREIDMVRSYDPAKEVLALFKIPGNKICAIVIPAPPTQKTPKALYDRKHLNILGN